MGFVSVATVVAWPLLALVYPLCASIGIIESDSSSDPRKKLVAYWILFSMIIFFEHAFMNLLQWVPIWPYIKLIISFLLVIPNFDGAFYVYEHLLRPCLFMDSRFLSNLFKEGEVFVAERNNLANEVKRYMVENRPEASEVASKVKVQNANNFVEKVEKRDVGAAKQVTQAVPTLSRTENKELAPSGSKELSEAMEAVRCFCPKRKQREWTCTVCQVTTQSETTLNSHLQGRRHQERCEELKGKNNQPYKTKSSAAEHNKSDKTEELKGKNNQPSKTKSSAAEHNKSDKIEELPSKTKSSAAEHNKSNKTEELKGKNNQPSKTKSSATEHKKYDKIVQESGDGVSTSSQKQRNKKMQRQTEKYECVERKQSLWLCTICNRSCTSMLDMECHLNGSKHLAQVEQLKTGSGIS